MTNIKMYAFHISIKLYAFNVSGKQKANVSYKYFMQVKSKEAIALLSAILFYLFQIHCLWWKENQIMLFGFTWTIEKR